MLPGNFEVLADVLAVRLIVQRLYARFALAANKDNAWLDGERAALLEDLKSHRIEITGVPRELTDQLQDRAEAVINQVFDNVRIQRPRTPPSSV
jgi:hypothetical protein